MAETAETHETDETVAAGTPLIWERIERAAHLPRTTLTHQRIAEAAVELADAEGLDAVTMRKLAERLGVATMALYRYVTGKEELYELMVDAATYAAPATPDSEADWYWRRGMHRYAEGVRQASRQHPWLSQAEPMVAGALTPRRLANTEQALHVLGATGLSQTSVLGVLRIVESYVSGAIATEVAQRQMLQRHGACPDGDPRMIYQEHMIWALGSGRYPKLREVIMSGAGRPDQEGSEFQIGLDCLLDGIAVRYGLA